ncbi:acyl-CoA synthetase [Pararhodobacter zhoushanensis]|uniref:AMP-binding protein n=1 Tax=Pararhodobacter zhoushanensis TaxID=2479545 RepID=A0ABT3H2L2_9RHOB|nr:AMP-binding protein [Pararhodobacter zhoushanensis]MCW1404405.1 AMP-binding protein [Novosphingobium sp. MW5]MCW1933993.1 AMP-binding protein [Pararhodobacter zhoushanensis]
MDRYETLRAGYDPRTPPTFNFGTDVVDAFAADTARNAAAPALIWCNAAGAERCYSFAEIATLSDRLAAALKRRGVQQGDRVLIMLPRVPAWQIAMVAALKLGAIAIPCVTMLSEKDIAYRLENSGARAVITTQAEIGKFTATAPGTLCIATDPALPPDVPGPRAPAPEGWDALEPMLAEDPGTFLAATVAAEDPALIFYTSGSTGLPKGVTHSARALHAWRGSAEHWLDLGPTDVMFCTADTGWSKAGTAILFGPWSRGATVLFYDGPFDPAYRLDLLTRHGVTVYCAAATELRRLVALDLSQHPLPALRLTVSAGESLNPPVMDAWTAMTGRPVLEAYGLTETLMLVANYRDTGIRAGSMGRPLPGVTLDLITAQGTLAAPGETGQIALRLPSAHLMLGYWQDPERTAKTLQTLDGVTYFLTSDNARADADGYLYYEGRGDDVINSAGYRIGPQEVENALVSHPAVREAAAVPSPDLERGEVVKAFVVLHDGHNGSPDLARALQDFVKSATAPYKYPRRIEFVSDLPKNAVGKIQRRVLRQQELDAAQAPKAPQ